MQATRRYASEEADSSLLARPLHFDFSGRTASSRFLKTSMTERLSSWDPQVLEARGVPSSNLINLYRRWGEGNFGLILTGNIMFEFDHLEAAGNAIIPARAPFAGERFDAFRNLAIEGKRHGALVIGQVSHPGRQVQENLQQNPISASDVHLKDIVLGMTFAKPRSASDAEIEEIINGFAHAAEYLEKSGFDGIELHGAHGYLLGQFLSLSTNNRTDKYGGTLENRSRIIFEVASAIRERVQPSFIIGIKINCVEFQANGFTAEEARQLCLQLEDNRFDFVELSGGTYESLAFSHRLESTKKKEAFFLDFAAVIAPALSKTKIYVTGGFKTAGGMTKALSVVDGVGLGRAVCQEPLLCRDILQGKVTGAVRQLLDENDFQITSVAAGAQMRQIGKDHVPIDLSLGNNEKIFMANVGFWRDKKSNDLDLQCYGYPDINIAIPDTPFAAG